MSVMASNEGAGDRPASKDFSKIVDGSPERLPDRVQPWLRVLSAVLFLSASITMLFSNAAVAHDAQARGAAMVQYQTDSGCAAAAAAWLIGMPNGTPSPEQQETWTVWAFYTRRAQASAEAAGRPTPYGVAAAQAFVADMLPQLKSPDAATAEKARAEAAAGTQHCAARPEFQNRLKDGTP